MSINLEYTRNEQDGIWQIDLSGELDVYSSELLKKKLYEILDIEMSDMNINIENLEYIDSTGLGALIGVLKRLKSEGKEINIANARKNVLKIFKITSLDKIFKMEE